jgi:uncharacterized iron-regulated membrane protein
MGVTSANSRKIVLLLHQYCGFIFAAYLIVICLSGSALVLLENQISGYRDYAQTSVAVLAHKVSLSEMVQTVERANPGKHVYHVLESCRSGCTYNLSMHDGANRLDVLVDPYTGKIVRTEVWERSAIGFLHSLHAELFAGDTGEAINATIGLSLVIMTLSGLYLWPGWRVPKRGFTIRWRGGTYRINYDIHKVVGIVSVCFLLMWSLTAAGIALWPSPPEQLVNAAHKNPQKHAEAFDALVRAGDSALDGPMTFAFTASNGVVVVRKQVPGDVDPYGYSYVAVNEYTGRVVRVQDVRTLPLLSRINMALYGIHVGAPGGIVLRTIYVVVGISPAVLFTTAFLMWLMKLKKEELRSRRHDPDRRRDGL